MFDTLWYRRVFQKARLRPSQRRFRPAFDLMEDRVAPGSILGGFGAPASVYQPSELVCSDSECVSAIPHRITLLNSDDALKPSANARATANVAISSGTAGRLAETPSANFDDELLLDRLAGSAARNSAPSGSLASALALSSHVATVLSQGQAFRAPGDFHLGQFDDIIANLGNGSNGGSTFASSGANGLPNSPANHQQNADASANASNHVNLAHARVTPLSATPRQPLGQTHLKSPPPASQLLSNALRGLDLEAVVNFAISAPYLTAIPAQNLSFSLNLPTGVAPPISEPALVTATSGIATSQPSISTGPLAATMSAAISPAGTLTVHATIPVATPAASIADATTPSSATATSANTLAPAGDESATVAIVALYDSSGGWELFIAAWIADPRGAMPANGAEGALEIQFRSDSGAESSRFVFDDPCSRLDLVDGPELALSTGSSTRSLSLSSDVPSAAVVLTIELGDTAGAFGVCFVSAGSQAWQLLVNPAISTNAAPSQLPPMSVPPTTEAQPGSSSPGNIIAGDKSSIRSFQTFAALDSDSISDLENGEVLCNGTRGAKGLDASLNGTPSTAISNGHADRNVADFPFKKELALGLRWLHPEWTDALIAQIAGVSRRTLFRWPEYRAAKEAQKNRWHVPSGSKSADGFIEAVDGDD